MIYINITEIIMIYKYYCEIIMIYINITVRL